MPRVIQLAGDTGSMIAGQLGQGLLAYQTGLSDYKEKQAKIDFYTEQTREKKLKSDQIEEYNLAVGGLGKGTGRRFSLGAADQQRSYKDSLFWRSDVATPVREAQESREGAYPDEVMNSAVVQEALRDTEAVWRAYRKSELFHPEASIRAMDDQAYEDALERQLRAVTSAMDMETARIFGRDQSQFVSEVRAVHDDQLDAIYGDKLRELVQETETEGGGGNLTGLKLLTNLRDEFYEQAAKKEDYAKWAEEAKQLQKSPNAVAALADYLSKELQSEKGTYLPDADLKAMEMLRAASLDTLTDVEANDPEEAAKAYTEAQDNWNKIQMAVNKIDGITNRQYESRAENMELQWQAAVGFQQAFSNDQEDAKSLIAQLHHLKTLVDVPSHLTDEQAARYRVEMAATEMNMALLDQNKSSLPTRFLHALLGQDLGDYTIDQVSDENWLLGDERRPGFAPVPDVVEEKPEKAPPSLEGVYVSSEKGQVEYTKSVEDAKNYSDTIAAIRAKAKYDTVNPRQEESFGTSFNLWNERAVPMNLTDKQVDAYVATRIKRLEDEFQAESRPQWFGWNTLSGNTKELRIAIARLRRLPKEERMKWMLKAEEMLIDTPRDYTSHLGPYKGSGTGLDMLRGLLGTGQDASGGHPLGSEVDTHDITVLANRLRAKGVSKPSGSTSISAEQEARRAAIRQQK
jgi:hypothetical protein